MSIILNILSILSIFLLIKSSFKLLAEEENKYLIIGYFLCVLSYFWIVRLLFIDTLKIIVDFLICDYSHKNITL